MATLAQHNRAATDFRLATRVASAAQIDGIPQARAWAETNIAEIVNVDIVVNGETTKLSNLHAYAEASFQPGINPEPGDDATKIGDEAVFTAVRAVRALQTNPTAEEANA